jgi:carboxymethylenebutenolidase
MLVTDQPTSPHRLVAQIEAAYYLGVAADDDEREPDTKTELQRRFASAGLPCTLEVYQATLHGWCMRDMPQRPGGIEVYNEPQAERAWRALLSHFQTALQMSAR